MIYSNGDYFVLHTVHPYNRPYKIVSCDYKLHTHVRSKKEAIDLANFAKYGNIPRNAKVDYLVSLQRLISSKDMIDKIQNLIDIKINRNKNKYYNSNKGVKKK